MAGVRTDETSVLPRFLDLEYPNIERGEGVWLTTTDGKRILDACSGGAMVACLGHGVRELAAAAAHQAERISYFYNHHFTSEPQERLADRLLEVVAPGMARVRLVSGGSEANETALQLARLYHVERGDTARWRVISPAQAYHGSTMGTLALSGRPSLQEPFGPYLASHRHLPPSTWRFDPTGEEALATLDEYRQFTAAVAAPVLANITEFGKTPLVTAAELAGAGVRLALYPLSVFRAMSRAAETVYAAIRTDGSQRSVVDQMQTRDQLYDVLGYHDYERRLDSYRGGE